MLDFDHTSPSCVGLGIAGLHKFLKYSTWFQKDLAPYVREGVARARGSRFLNADFLARVAEQHIQGRKNYSAELNSILTLETIERKLLRGWPPGLDN